MSAKIFSLIRNAGKFANCRTLLIAGNSPTCNFMKIRPCSNIFQPDITSNKENSSPETDDRLRNDRKAKNIHDSEHSFSDFNIIPAIQDRLKQLGYQKPFEIQAKSLQHTLNDRNVIGRAITGSGKTLAFAIPIVQKIILSNENRTSVNPKAIVVAPTRELCNQIFQSIKEISSSVKCVALYGGASFNRQLAEMARGVDVICATPGRLNDHIMRETVHLHDVKFICLDEADELLNDNFKEQVETVLEYSPRDKQMMLFSATLPRDIIYLIQKHMPDPEYIDITTGQRYKIPENVQHAHIESVRQQHLPILCSLLERHNPERCIVFTRTRANTRDVCRVLQSFLPVNFRSDFINSDLSQARREMVLGKFRNGRLNILCATDVAARGLDIPEVDLIIQVEPPQIVENYIHRSGRTGRAGRPGLNIIIHSSSKVDKEMLADIENKVPIGKWDVPDDAEKIFEVLNKNVYRQLLAYEASAPLEKKKTMRKKENQFFKYSKRRQFNQNYSDHDDRSFNRRRRLNDDDAW